MTPRPADGRARLVRERLRSRDGVVRALIVEFLDPALVEFAASLGYDLLILDAEHGPVDRGLGDLVRAAESGGTPALLRLPAGVGPLGAYLDQGVAGLHLAQAESAAEVERVVDALKFRPLGRRGAGRTRLAGYGALRQDAAFTAGVDARTILLVAIESPAGVECAHEIAGNPAVDGLLAGTLDLSHALGAPGERSHPEVAAAVGRVEEAARGAGKAFGLPHGTAGDAQAAVAAGATLLLGSLSALLLEAARADVDADLRR